MWLRPLKDTLYEKQGGERPDASPVAAGTSTLAAALFVDCKTPAQACTSVLRELAFTGEERKATKRRIHRRPPRLLVGSQGSLRTSRRLHESPYRCVGDVTVCVVNVVEEPVTEREEAEDTCEDRLGEKTADWSVMYAPFPKGDQTSRPGTTD